jgi:hypothetical protein
VLGEGLGVRRAIEADRHDAGRHVAAGAEEHRAEVAADLEARRTGNLEQAGPHLAEERQAEGVEGDRVAEVAERLRHEAGRGVVAGGAGRADAAVVVGDLLQRAEVGEDRVGADGLLQALRHAAGSRRRAGRGSGAACREHEGDEDGEHGRAPCGRHARADASPHTKPTRTAARGFDRRAGVIGP